MFKNITRLSTVRCYSSAASALVKPQFKSIEEIHKYIDNSVRTSWDPSMFCKPPKKQNSNNSTSSQEEEYVKVEKISIDELRNLLTLSGLEFAVTDKETERRQQGLLDSLNNQINFLAHLHSVRSLEKPLVLDDGSVEQEISSDARILNQNHKPMTYDELIYAIQELSELQLAENVESEKKGENVGDWEPVELAKLKEDGFYIIKEKVNKK